MAKYTFIASEKVYTHNVIFTKKEINKFLTCESVPVTLLVESLKKFIRKSNKMNDKYDMLYDINDDNTDAYGDHMNDIVYNASDARIVDENGDTFRIDFISQRCDNMTVISTLNDTTYVVDIVLDGDADDEKASIDYVEAYTTSKEWLKEECVRDRDNISDTIPGVIALKTLQFFAKWYQISRVDIAPSGEVISANDGAKFMQYLNSYYLYDCGEMDEVSSTKELYDTFNIPYTYDKYMECFTI